MKESVQGPTWSCELIRSCAFSVLCCSDMYPRAVGTKVCVMVGSNTRPVVAVCRSASISSTLRGRKLWVWAPAPAPAPAASPDVGNAANAAASTVSSASSAAAAAAAAAAASSASSAASAAATATACGDIHGSPTSLNVAPVFSAVGVVLSGWITRRLVPARYRSPRQPSHVEPLFLELHSIL